MDLLHTFSLADVSREHRRSYPDRPAVVDGDTRLTWPQFDDRVNRLANALTAEGVGPGDVVLWMGQNSYRILECLAAAAKLGAVCGIVNWRQSADEMAFVIADAGAAVTIWQEAEVGDTVRAARQRSGSPGRWLRHDSPAPAEGVEDTDSYEAFLASGSPHDPARDIEPGAAVLLSLIHISEPTRPY